MFSILENAMDVMLVIVLDPIPQVLIAVVPVRLERSVYKNDLSLRTAYHVLFDQISALMH